MSETQTKTVLEEYSGFKKYYDKMPCYNYYYRYVIKYKDGEVIKSDFEPIIENDKIRILENYGWIRNDELKNIGYIKEVRETSKKMLDKGLFGSGYGYMYKDADFEEICKIEDVLCFGFCE